MWDRGSRNQTVVVIGLGRFGSSLAVELMSEGAEVLAIDSDPKIVQGLAGEVTHVVAADSTDLETLRQLGVGELRRAVVGIGTDVEASILTTSALVDLGIPSIWAKAVSRAHGRILERVGAHHVVLPEHQMGERVAHLVLGRMLDYFEVEPGFAMVKTTPPADVVGRTLRESAVRSRYGVTVVFVRHPGGTFEPAGPDTVPQTGDVIIVAGDPRRAERFAP